MPRSVVYRYLALTMLALVGAVVAESARAGPVYGLETVLKQPDETPVMVRVWGDEYYQHIETRTGYTLVRDSVSGWIEYAGLAADGGSLRPTGVRAGEEPPPDIGPGTRLAPDIVAAHVAAAQARAGQPGAFGDKTGGPIPVRHGAVRGVALLIDFSDQPAEVDRDEIDAFLNDVHYDGFGNIGSVRDYYHDVSAGRLELTHEVAPFYYRAAHPKLWYENPSEPQGAQARILVTEALEALDRSGFDFSQYDANGDGYIDLVSAFYAGQPSWGWGYGLWPQAGTGVFYADGVVGRLWQISPIGDHPRLGIPVHEMGHALLQWPDLYDLGGDSWGLGMYGLMSNPGSHTNPFQPCGPMKYEAEWTETILLDGVMRDLEAPVTGNRVFVLPHPSLNTEFYLVENRQQVGRDAGLPDSGLAIYHVDWLGSNNFENRLANSHYMVTLVQADGRWDLENDVNSGDDTDLFGAPEFTEFGPETVPRAMWWRQYTADMHLTEISRTGNVMTFHFHDGIGILPLQLVCEPERLVAGWRITGADGYVKHGSGSRLVHVPAEGSYVVTWLGVPGWQAPPASTVYVPPDDSTPEVRGLYTHPPFAATHVPALGGPTIGRGGQAVDYDDDGDLDLYLCRQADSDLLLRNEGGWQFTNMTPAAAGGTTTSIAVQWSDYDADGRRDLFLVREGAANVLLRQIADDLWSSPEFLPDGIDAVHGAMWVDFDRDGRLDLHLVRDGKSDILLRAPDKSTSRLDEYELLDILPGISSARSRAASWCDYDGNGYPDLYTVILYGDNMLARNRTPARFINANHGGLGLPWRAGAAAWGDYDNDGDFDLYTVQDGATDFLFRQFDETFVIASGENMGAPGSGKDVAWGDFDNDGDLDLYLARAGDDDQLLLGDGAGRWRRAPLLLDEVAGQTIAVIAADFDNDGGLDVLLDRDGQPAVLLRNTIDRGHWLQVEPVGGGTLQEPAGAVLRAYVGGRTLLRQVSRRSGPSSVSRRIHFGLGAVASVDSLEILWANGARQCERNLAADQILTIVQTEFEQPSDPPPATTELGPVYPNPFNPVATIRFDLAHASPVRVAVFDVRGRRVAMLLDEDFPAGRHVVRWSGLDDTGRPMASGVYVTRFQGDGSTQCQRMALVR